MKRKQTRKRSQNRQPSTPTLRQASYRFKYVFFPLTMILLSLLSLSMQQEKTLFVEGSQNSPAFVSTTSTTKTRIKTTKLQLQQDDNNDSATKKSTLTDWVVENLEDSSSSSSTSNKITSTSTTRAGENDVLPTDGLIIADKFRILPAGRRQKDDSFQENDELHTIHLLLGRNGWGTGVHPTTRLCLEFLSSPNIMSGGETVLDYGCGSGILSIASLYLGASRAIGVDIEAEALVTSERNLDLNGFGDRFEGLHTREIIPYCLCRPTGVNICIANILIGQLVRPSMVSAIISNMAPKSYLCLSGIRPHEVDALKNAYGEYVDWIDEYYDELAACDTEGSIESYGFDVGTWARVVGRLKEGGGGQMDIESLSELAVS